MAGKPRTIFLSNRLPPLFILMNLFLGDVLMGMNRRETLVSDSNKITRDIIECKYENILRSFITTMMLQSADPIYLGHIVEFTLLSLYLSMIFIEFGQRASRVSGSRVWQFRIRRDSSSGNRKLIATGWNVFLGGVSHGVPSNFG